MSKRKIAVLLGMVLTFILIRYLDVDEVLSVETLISNKDRLINFTSNYYLISMIIFLVSNILLGAVGVPVFAVYTLAAGLIFGFLEGMILSLSASLIGGYISFFLSRYAFSAFFRKRYAHRLKRVEKKLEDNSFAYLLGLRLLPGFPYFITNIVAGLSPISESIFLTSTFFGILPSTTLFIYTGHVLREIDHVSQFFALKYLWPIIAVVVVTMTALILRLRKNKAI